MSKDKEDLFETIIYCKTPEDNKKLDEVIDRIKVIKSKLENKITQLQQELDKHKLVASGRIAFNTYDYPYVIVTQKSYETINTFPIEDGKNLKLSVLKEYQIYIKEIGKE